MLRTILTYVIPFLLPLAGYALWVWYRTRHAAQHGGEAPSFEKGPWPLMLLLGAFLSLIVLGATAMLTGGNPGDIYTSARVENGKLIPGTMTPREPAPTP